MDGESVYLAVVGETLYHSRESFRFMEEIYGQVPGTGTVRFVPFLDGVYLLTGAGIRRFDGEALSEIEPYVPLVMISTPPDGAGVSFEEVNLLTPLIRQSFSPDGSATKFIPAVKNLKGVQSVKVNGRELEEKHYFYHELDGYLEILNAPPAGTDTVEAVFELDREDPSARILNCRFGLGFGGANDTRVFLYGNADTPAVRYHSGVVDGRPSFSYFPAFGYTFVGTGAPITAMIRHYDRQLIFTEQAAYYSYLEYMTGENGKLVASFPVLPLSDDRGSAAFGQAIPVDNTPCTLTETGIYQWISTNVRDERNAVCISDSIAHALQKEDLSDGILFYRKASSELYAVFGRRVYVYHTRMKLFYSYVYPEVICGLLEVGNDTYFYTEKGIFLIGGETDDGESISASWYSGDVFFGDGGRSKSIYGASLLGHADKESSLELFLLDEDGGVRVERNGFLRGSGRYCVWRMRLRLRRCRRLGVGIRSVDGSPGFRGIRLVGKVMDK